MNQIGSSGPVQRGQVFASPIPVSVKVFFDACRKGEMSTPKAVLSAIKFAFSGKEAKIEQFEKAQDQAYSVISRPSAKAPSIELESVPERGETKSSQPPRELQRAAAEQPQERTPTLPFEPGTPYELKISNTTQYVGRNRHEYNSEIITQVFKEIQPHPTDNGKVICIALDGAPYTYDKCRIVEHTKLDKAEVTEMANQERAAMKERASEQEAAQKEAQVRAKLLPTRPPNTSAE